jgi:hypothetical protein
MLNSIRVELMFLLLLLTSAIFGIGDHVLHLKNFISLFQVVVFNLELLLFKTLIPIFHSFKPLILLLLRLSVPFIFLHKVSEDFIFFKLAVLLLLPLKVIYLDLNLANLVPGLFLILSSILNILVALADLLLELGDLVHFIVGHPQGCSVVGGFLEDLRDQLFTFFYELLLTVIRGF